jgi:hypothetical protein
VEEAAEGRPYSDSSLLPFTAPRKRCGGLVNEFALESAKEVSDADEKYYRAMGMGSSELKKAWKRYTEHAAVNGAIIANELLRLSRDDDTE